MTLFQLAPHVSYAAQVSIPGAAHRVTNDVLSGAFDNGAEGLPAPGAPGQGSIGQSVPARGEGPAVDADVNAEIDSPFLNYA